MKEQLLQFIWRYRHFNQQELCTETGEPIQILSPGNFNTHQGPDFLDAVVRIGDTLWIGNIELHVAAGDWHRHAHEDDKHYRNVILHVVWEHDHTGQPAITHPHKRGPLPGIPTDDPTGQQSRNIPTLLLRHRVPKLLLGQYEAWMHSPSFIPCQQQLHLADTKTWSHWKTQLLEERLIRRVERLSGFLAEGREHWDEAIWWLLARTMGLPVNADAFEAIARSLPIELLTRHRERPDQLEALLLGQAGLLEQDFTEAWPQLLFKEFRHLRNRYRLPPLHQPVLFLRMRPGNLPTIRLAQLATLLSRPFSWLTLLKEADTPQDLRTLLDATAGPYWDTHYRWEQVSVCRPKRIGTSMQDSLLINTFIPVLYAYGQLRGEKPLQEKARKWLSATRPERNTHTTGWAHLGVEHRHAADSQALLELKTRYCEQKKCLDCAIGKALLGKTT